MKFTEVSMKEVRGDGTPFLVKEFMESGIQCAEVDFGDEYKTVGSCRTSLKRYVRQNELPVEVTSRDGRVFLINKEVEKDV